MNLTKEAQEILPANSQLCIILAYFKSTNSKFPGAHKLG